MTTFPRPKVITMGPVVDMSRPQPKPGIDVRGMFGIGDCIFQRAVLRDLMVKYKDHSVVLTTYYRDMFWDLEREGLKLDMVKDRGRIRDSDNRSPEQRGHPPLRPRKIEQLRLTYDRDSIHKNGSILAAMYASANMRMPKQPDFSMPVPNEWVARWRLYLKNECARRKIKVTKPILVYRPIVLNTGWTATSRAPDPKAYDALFEKIREKFFVVSVADLKDKANGQREWIVGAYRRVDLDLNHGELDFATLCGLFKDAALAFTNPGFTPVLAHAVGTPVIIVYGGNETFATTNSVGRHLAPTLAIDTDRPCPCHLQVHRCDKTITLPPAIKRVCEFTEQVLDGSAKMDKVTAPAVSASQNSAERSPSSDAATAGAVPRVLIFGTTYVDTAERAELTKMWYELHSQLNPGCDLLLVDSKSPIAIGNAQEPALNVFRFSDNIGHLSRNGPKGPSSAGRDGWGRAFCRGLDIAAGLWPPSQGAAQRDWDYVVHIEGDSLFKHPVMPIITKMKKENTKVLTVPVKGTKSIETGWVETGLMFFDVEWLKQSLFTKNYDWANRKPSPTPERVIHDMLLPLGGAQYRLMSWSALRGDKQQINANNICNLDWVTHVRNNKGMDDVKLFRRFVDHALKAPPADVADPHAADVEKAPPVAGSGEKATTITQTPPPIVMPESKVKVDNAAIKPASLKINLGCGTNKLPGWENRDADVDIRKRLPWSENQADFIFAEHVIEHVMYQHAINFLKECHRVLKPNGVVRITTPSIEFLKDRGDQEYFDWVHGKGWAPTNDRRGAMHAILYSHGHQIAWTSSFLLSTMYYCGFEKLEVCEVGMSKHTPLVGVEGHDKVIGKKFNWIESLCIEGTKP